MLTQVVLEKEVSASRHGKLYDVIDISNILDMGDRAKQEATLKGLLPALAPGGARLTDERRRCEDTHTHTLTHMETRPTPQTGAKVAPGVVIARWTSSTAPHLKEVLFPATGLSYDQVAYYAQCHLLLSPTPYLTSNRN